MTGTLIAGWLFFFCSSIAASSMSIRSTAFSLLLLLPLSAGCTSYCARDVAGWQQIQEAYSTADADGLSDEEIEQIARLCLRDAQLCEKKDARFGRLLFALAQTKKAADLELAQRLWTELFPDVTDIALNQEHYALLVLGTLSYLDQETREGVSRELEEIDHYLSMFMASDSASIRNHARFRRAFIRVQAMKRGVPAEKDKRKDEIASLLADARKDGLIEIGGDVSRMFLGYGNLASHGIPEIGHNAWVARDGDPAWWRRASDTSKRSWSIVFFTSADCPYCEPFWNELLQTARSCEASGAPRIIAVLSSEAIPRYLQQTGSWGVYRNSLADEGWFSCWGVSAVPAAFILDGEDRFLRVFLSLEEVATAIQDCATAQG